MGGPLFERRGQKSSTIAGPLIVGRRDCSYSCHTLPERTWLESRRRRVREREVDS